MCEHNYGIDCGNKNCALKNNNFEQEIEKIKDFTQLQAKGFIIGNIVKKYIDEGCTEDIAIKIAHLIIEKLLST